MLLDLINNPDFQCNPRGLSILENLSVTYELDNPRDPYINFLNTFLPERQEVYDKYREEELAWYLSGNLSAESAPSKFWLKIADKDGNIRSNYGQITLFDTTKYPGNVTALQHVVNLLVNDNSSRQAIVHYNLPSDYWEGNKDVPCTLSHQLFIRNSKLYMITTQRSCDIFLGLQYDVCWSCEFQQIVQKELSKRGINVELGSFVHQIGSLHLYVDKLPLAKRVVECVVRT